MEGVSGDVHIRPIHFTMTVFSVHGLYPILLYHEEIPHFLGFTCHINWHAHSELHKCTILYTFNQKCISHVICLLCS